MKQKLFYLATSLTALLPAGMVGAGISSAVAAGSAPPAAPVIADSFGALNSNLFCPIINVMFYVLISIAVIMVFWGAYIYLTAGDDTEKVHKATKTLTYAAVAIVVALLARGFPSIIGSIFNQSGNTTITC